MASTEGTTLPVGQPGLDWTGKGGVVDDHSGLSQSKYEEVSANGPVSDFTKVAIFYLKSPSVRP